MSFVRNVHTSAKATAEKYALLLGSKCESVKGADMSVYRDHQTGVAIAGVLDMCLRERTVIQTDSKIDSAGEGGWSF